MNTNDAHRRRSGSPNHVRIDQLDQALQRIDAEIAPLLERREALEDERAAVANLPGGVA